ncbi:BTB/POZ domain-containing protein At5g47800 isoform X2 [Sesamum indicum]|uniref:BTB/POZ domain-containing protein At5g47800 isoform X2 n=1 Tax=Sesamum indicum TaxID=4182 RepID=A0A6I9U8T6_SESIN|nr:BTB/POZ domain-containing protein At5g47800 isoform X2 [Sesamum indicum]
MKFMKLGTRPDTFYTEEATRTVMSDVPSDLTVQINDVTYLLHKYPLLPKSGLLQRLCSESDDRSNSVALDLHDIPGGEEAFELCAKFCYGITINLSAHNFVSAFCAAKFLRMTEAVEKGNLAMKLEAFFSSCILEGWKDSILTLQNTEKVYEWSENLGIIRRCIESIVDKILTPPTKVTWSYTYTRPGYWTKRHQSSVPRDWWTEDLSFLGIDIFRCIVAAVKSTNMLQPQLIGEALHVYASRWLPEITENRPNETSTSQEQDSPGRKQKILETIVGLIPADKGSVSIKFLLRLLRITNFLAVSPVTKAELLRLSGLQLEEATLSDLLLPAQTPNDQTSTNIDMVTMVLESFLRQWRRQTPADESRLLMSIQKIGKLIDSYLPVVAKDANMPVQKVASLAETLPGIARPHHDDLYKAINIYLKEHPELSKIEKKQLCRVLDCQKLSPGVRAHAVRNEHLPLRTVVQILFFEQEKGNYITNKKHTSRELGTAGVLESNDKLPLRPTRNREGKSEMRGFCNSVEFMQKEIK